MMGKLGLFMGSVIAMPVIGQLSPESAVGELAKGGAQMILAVVVVAEAIAIFKMFKLWRDDIESEREDRKTEREKFEEIIKDNAEANTRLATTNEALKDSVYHFAKVVESCDKKE